MGKRFEVHVSTGDSFVIEAQGHADAACGLLCNPTKYPIPDGAVVGIEGPRGSARFYKKRGMLGRGNLWPISASAAAVETHHGKL